jgi:hypothetical protein
MAVAMSFEDLPEHIVEDIFLQLSLDDLQSCKLVSRQRVCEIVHAADRMNHAFAGMTDQQTLSCDRDDQRSATLASRARGYSSSGSPLDQTIRCCRISVVHYSRTSIGIPDHRPFKDVSSGSRQARKEALRVSRRDDGTRKRVCLFLHWTAFWSVGLRFHDVV